MKLFLIDTFVGENFLARETLAAALPLICPIDFNINSCLLYDSCIIPAVEEQPKAASARGISNFRSGGGRAGEGGRGRRRDCRAFVGAAALFSSRFMIFAAGWQELV